MKTILQKHNEEIGKEFDEKLGGLYCNGRCEMYSGANVKKFLLANNEKLAEAIGAEAKEEARNEVRGWIEKQPQDFCNDGEYSKDEMIACLSGVIKKFYADLFAFLSPPQNPLEEAKQAIIAEIIKKLEEVEEKEIDVSLYAGLEDRINTQLKNVENSIWNAAREAMLEKAREIYN